MTNTPAPPPARAESTAAKPARLMSRFRHLLDHRGIAAGYLIAFAIAIELRPKMQCAVLAAFLLGYWAALELVPVPGIGAGDLTPDRNLATWLDRLVLGRFQHGENTWFLSYPGFASSVLLGVLAGRLLMSPASEKSKVAGLPWT